ncbi:hypothetical protein AB1Y20_013839 [Prymnesium parvum]|uniref:H(+)-exporting diphosphatase n=1 Tax=Prymnesium parvum TaxID=97485 RepID=A0AB34IG66_PRYPA|mmetsp:Transcript_66099/g.117101  ORF Transcript_66099/g.117101 Transcript_66099/m.117101 type:complete len:147 (-) Transcript_66099:75-515(-)
MGLSCVLLLGLQLLGGVAVADAWAASPRTTTRPQRPPPAAPRMAIEHIPQLLAEDIFGSVFAAGMSIALAGVGTTMVAAFIVNGRYDEIERSMFESQDQEAADAAAKQEGVKEDVREFFGDINPQMAEARESTADAEPQGGKEIMR